MLKKTPYDIVKSRYITEKSVVLQELKNNTSNPSVKKCNTSKYVFLVDIHANKREIANAVEEIYAEKNIRVIGVNTITNKAKPRRVRGREGKTASFKKAIVTLEAGDTIEDQV